MPSIQQSRTPSRVAHRPRGTRAGPRAPLSARLLLTAGACASMRGGGMMGADKMPERMLALGMVSDMGEIDEGALAMVKATSLAVRQYAEAMVRDHRAAMMEHKQMMGTMSVPLARIQALIKSDPALARMMGDHMSAMMRYHMVEGAEFDPAYLGHQAAMHEMALAEMDAMMGRMSGGMKSGADGGAGNMMAMHEKMRTMLSAHLTQARGMRQSMGSTGSR